jgi:hypothetical protein
MGENKLFSEEIQNAIKSIDNELRIQIIELLNINSSLSYSQLLNKLSISKGKLNYHLDILTENGILNNFVFDQILEHFHSYYELSQFGKDFIYKINSVFDYVSIKETDMFNKYSEIKTYYHPKNNIDEYLLYSKYINLKLKENVNKEFTDILKPESINIKRKEMKNFNVYKRK